MNFKTPKLMTTIPFKDKLKFALVSLKKNAPILLLCLPFIIIGSTVIYFAAKTNLSAYIFIFGNIHYNIIWERVLFIYSLFIIFILLVITIFSSCKNESKLQQNETGIIQKVALKYAKGFSIIKNENYKEINDKFIRNDWTRIKHWRII